MPQQLAVIGGKVYGITEEGGPLNEGALFEFSLKSKKETVLLFFGFNNEGQYPNFLNASGKELFISTQTGTIYAYDTLTKKGATLYNVEQGNVGAVSQSVLDIDGDLYGTAIVRKQQSVLFQVNAMTGAEKTLFSFNGGKEGGYTIGQLAYKDGILYGAVDMWNNYLTGGFYRYDLATGREKMLYVLNETKDGAGPNGITPCNGLFYSSTWSGGANGFGTVFSVDPATGDEKTLYNFAGGTDGYGGYAPLTCLGGNLYGTGPAGANNYGDVYEINTKTGQETVLHNFTGADGAYPTGQLISSHGVLYGTTGNEMRYDSISPGGTIFELAP